MYYPQDREYSALDESSWETMHFGGRNISFARHITQRTYITTFEVENVTICLSVSISGDVDCKLGNIAHDVGQVECI